MGPQSERGPICGTQRSSAPIMGRRGLDFSDPFRTIGTLARAKGSLSKDRTPRWNHGRVGIRFCVLFGADRTRHAGCGRVFDRGASSLQRCAGRPAKPITSPIIMSGSKAGGAREPDRGGHGLETGRLPNEGRLEQPPAGNISAC